jgi:hypothetical protein
MYDPLNVVTVGFYGTAEKQQWDCSDSTVCVVEFEECFSLSQSISAQSSHI